MGEILFSTSAKQVRNIRIPASIIDKKIRKELELNISEAADALDNMNMTEEENLRAQLISEVILNRAFNFKILQSDAKIELYQELAYADNAGEIINLKPETGTQDTALHTKFRNAMEEKILLLHENEYCRQTEAELNRIDQILRKAGTSESLENLQFNASFIDDTIAKILFDRIAKKRLLLRHHEYIEKMTEQRAGFFEFLCRLRKTFTFRALDEIKIPAIDDPGQSERMKTCLLLKRNFFEAQQARDHQITVLRESLN